MRATVARPMHGTRDLLTSRHHLYYGWYVVGACHLVAWMTWGIGVFNQGVFLGFFTQAYG